jgi:hypothetical protein
MRSIFIDSVLFSQSDISSDTFQDSLPCDIFNPFVPPFYKTCLLTQGFFHDLFSPLDFSYVGISSFSFWV